MNRAFGFIHERITNLKPTTSTLKTNILLSILAITSLQPAQAQAFDVSPLDPWIPKGSITIIYQEAYLAGRVSKPLIRDFNMGAELALEWQNGLMLSYAQYEALNAEHALQNGSSETSEALLSVGYKWKWHEIDLRAQATLINLHPHGEWFSDDRLALELYISRQFKFGKHTLTPELRLGWFSFWDHIDDGVPFVIPALTHVWDQPLGAKQIALRTRIAVEADSGFNRHDSGAFFQIETGLQWKLWKNATLTFPGYKLIEPFSHDRSDGRGEGSDTFFTSLTFRF